jgi:Bacterial translation initiation factor IF-2 associated region./Translation initiation factor IF-2, N-terminal region.
MPEVTVNQFAQVVGISVERLLQQLEEAGFAGKDAEARISDEEKTELLSYLRRKHGKNESAEPRKITLKRKTQSEIKVPLVVQGRGKTRSKTVNVEFRKKRTYIKRSVIEEEQAAVAAKAAEVEPGITPRTMEEQAPSTELSTVAKTGQQAVAETAGQAMELPLAAMPTAATPHTEPVTMPPHNVTDAAAIVEPGTAKKHYREGKADANRKAEPGEDKHGKHGWQELHVATDKSGRRKKRQKYKPVVMQVSTLHGFEKPTAPIVREVQIPGKHYGS